MTKEQLNLFPSAEIIPETEPDLDSYDYIIVACSGGKDSIACVLHLLDIGIDPSRIELWHHRVDGLNSELMDWPCTDDYVKKFAKAFNLKIYYTWKEGGFEREMLRDNQPTAPISFETPNGKIKTVGGTKKSLGTRKKFPQVAASLTVRWCSAYLKIDVAARALRHQERFINSKTLFITGERAEEGRYDKNGKPCGRAAYAEFETHTTDLRNGKSYTRHIDHWRPVHKWTENRIWDIIRRFRVNVHPAYHLGWGRLSCASCIFGSKHQWASLNAINPKQVKRIINYEIEFKRTIHRKKSVPELIAEGTPYPSITKKLTEIALSKTYSEKIILDLWHEPAGAYGENAGPT